jgi:hypothetical protein
MDQRTLWSAIGILSAGCVVAAVFKFSGGRASEPEALEFVQPQAVVLKAVAEAESGDSRLASSESTRTLREFLEEHWGAEWEGVREAIEKNLGSRLDEPLRGDPLRPWEEVADEVRDQSLLTAKAIAASAEADLEWDDSLTESWDSIRGAFPSAPEDLRDVELQEFRTLANQANEKIRNVAYQRAMMRADAFADKWKKGEWTVAPYALPGPTKGEKGRQVASLSSCASSTGWVTGCVLYADELPSEWSDLRFQIQKLVYERSTTLAQYLDSKK